MDVDSCRRGRGALWWCAGLTLTVFLPTVGTSSAQIFADGFESGDLGAWSDVAP